MAVKKLKRARKPAVFLDRDGTLMPDVGYLNRVSQVRLYSRTVQALKLLRANGFYLFVVTNQSGAARGYFKVGMVHKANRKLQGLLKARGASLDAFFYCPHYSGGKVRSLSKVCGCRKPKPGMVKQASGKYPLDLKRSYVVGDKIDDVLLAKNARVSAGILVRTGNGRRNEAKLEKAGLKGTVVAADVLQAARYIVEQKRKALLAVSYWPLAKDLKPLAIRVFAYSFCQKATANT